MCLHKQPNSLSASRARTLLETTFFTLAKRWWINTLGWRLIIQIWCHKPGVKVKIIFSLGLQYWKNYYLFLFFQEFLWIFLIFSVIDSTWMNVKMVQRKEIAIPHNLDQGWEPTYNHWPHESWNIAGGPPNINLILSSNSTFIFRRKIRRENYVKEREILLLAFFLRVCLSWSFVLTRCCVLGWGKFWSGPY